MTKDTLFRGWSNKEKTFKFCNMTIKNIVTDCKVEMFYEEDIEITQSLGFKDKNNKELYQGDIAYCKGFEHPKKKLKCVWNAEDCQFVFIELDSKYNIGQCASFYDEVEIIGNIYETTNFDKSNGK